MTALCKTRVPVGMMEAAEKTNTSDEVFKACVVIACLLFHRVFQVCVVVSVFFLVLPRVFI